MKRRSKIFAVAGILSIILTLSVVMLNIMDWSGITVVALLFILWSEIVLFVGMILIEKYALETSQIILRIGCGTTIVAYSVAVFIISWIYLLFFKQSIKSFFTIQMSMFSLAIVIGMIFAVSSRSIRETNKKINDSSMRIASYVDRLITLKNNSSDESVSTILNKMAENLRYSDCTMYLSVDGEMEKVISLLELEMTQKKEEKSEMRIEALCVKLDSLINKRKSNVNAAKRGGI